MNVNVSVLIQIIQDETLMSNKEIAGALDVSTGRLSNMKRQSGLSAMNIKALADIAGMTGKQLIEKHNAKAAK